MTDKPISKSFQRAIDAAKRLGFTEPKMKMKISNPYTRVSCELEPLAVMMYNFITTKEFVCEKDFTRQEWDWARYGFMAQWPEEYYKLLD